MKKIEKHKTFEDKVFISIEQLLRHSGYCGHLVSVCDEANKYSYKTFDGKVGSVDKSFIHDRIKTETWKQQTF